MKALYTTTVALSLSTLCMAQTTSTCDCWIEPDASYTLAMQPNDDGSSAQINLPFDFDLYGESYSSVFINNNGNLSFVQAFGTFSSSGFPNATNKMVAPFWADVDTRSAGQVWYKVTAGALYVNWVGVGHFSQSTNRRNWFQVILTDGEDAALGADKNVSFCYKDMQWTTGNSSGGTNGFGGTASSVGVNRGNGVDFFQLTRSDQPGTFYDGPFGDNDGVGWLANKGFVFSTSTSAANIAPIPTSTFLCDTLRACAGSLTNVEVTFLSPENGEVTVGSSEALTLSDWNEDSNISGIVASVSGSFTPTLADLGFHTITFTGTDNGAPALSTTVEVIVEVVDGPTEPPTIDGPSEFCAGVTVTLIAQGPFSSFLWNDGQTTQSITVSDGGSYSVTAGSGSCQLNSAVFELEEITPPGMTIGGDAFFCGDGSTSLTATAGFDSYAWSTGDTSATVVVPSGTYTVVGTLQGCTSATVSFTTESVDPGAPVITGDTVLCPGNTVVLSFDPSPYDGFTWNTGQITQPIPVTIPGEYTVTALFDECVYTSTATVIDGGAFPQLEAVQGPDVTPPTGAVQFTATPTLLDADSVVWTIPLGWTWANGNVSTAPSVFLVPPPDPGLYTICATAYTAGCQGTEVCFETEIITGLQSSSLGEGELNAFPNPSHGSFSIALPNGLIPTAITVQDALGRTVQGHQVELRSEVLQVDLRGMAAGRYALGFTLGAQRIRVPLIVIE